MAFLLARSASIKPSFRSCRPVTQITSVFRPTTFRSISSISKTTIRTPTTLFCKQSITGSLWRHYSEAHLSKDEITERVLGVLRKFYKIEGSGLQVTSESHFTNDLSLDSLDAVELLINIEEEFNIEIPDAESEKILSVKELIDYLSGHPHAR